MPLEQSRVWLSADGTIFDVQQEMVTDLSPKFLNILPSEKQINSHISMPIGHRAMHA